MILDAMRIAVIPPLSFPIRDQAKVSHPSRTIRIYYKNMNE